LGAGTSRSGRDTIMIIEIEKIGKCKCGACSTYQDEIECVAYILDDEPAHYLCYEHMARELERLAEVVRAGNME
jgi:hypothetical protein